MEQFIDELKRQAYALEEEYRSRIILSDEKEDEFILRFTSPNGYFYTERRFYKNERDNYLGSYKLFCRAPWVGESVIIDELTEYRLNKNNTLLTILESDDKFFSERDEEGSVNTIYYKSYTLEQFSGTEGTFLRKMQRFLSKGKVLNKFILHFSMDGYTVWSVKQDGTPLKL